MTPFYCYNITKDYCDDFPRTPVAIVIYDKVLISFNSVPNSNIGKIDVNKLKHDIVFAPTLLDLKKNNPRLKLVEKYKNEKVVIDTTDISSHNYVLCDPRFHEKSLGNLFSDNPKRILKCVAELTRDSATLECDVEVDLNTTTYYTTFCYARV